MSKIPLSADQQVPTKRSGVRTAFATWLHANHGDAYRTAIHRFRSREGADRFAEQIRSCTPSEPTSEPLVGIVGGGFAGMFAGLILQSLGIECELFEASNRVGGRIFTWYSKDHTPTGPNAGLYGEVGGMRVPQFSEDMLPVQQLALAVNAVLERNGLSDQAVIWRKFYYSSDYQRMRFNEMDKPIDASAAATNPLGFDEASGGNLDAVWTEIIDDNGTKTTRLNQVLGQVNGPFLDAIDASFAAGFAMLMQYDQYSMWDYLTNVFTLGSLGPYYDPRMGAKSDPLPWAVASYLETTNVGTGMYGVSFVEMVIAVYDWGGSIDPYPADDAEGVFMVTVDQGMQRFPDACHTVLNLQRGVTPADGHTAQVTVGMVPETPGGPYNYTATNLTPDARRPNSKISPASPRPVDPSPPQQRVFLEKKVTHLEHDPELYGGHGGMSLTVDGEKKSYPYVITTLPNGNYLNGSLGPAFLDGLSFAKATALREVEYMPAFKAFITFKKQFWQIHGERNIGLGVASTDQPVRQVVYPTYGYDKESGVLQIYCWAQDARRLGALTDEERVNECLRGIQFLYPEVDVYQEFAGYEPEVTTKTWFWDTHAGGGAFALFNPGQYKNLYSTLLTPEFGGSLNFAGECCSVHHGWIVGALDSAYNAVRNILLTSGATERLAELEETWGTFSAPDISTDAATANILEYADEYNLVDRAAGSVAPGAKESIYENTAYVFEGNIPAFVADFSKVPQSMKKTATDDAVLAMLNQQWEDNVALRTQAAPANPDDTAAKQLEALFYGTNFQTIPAPAYWLDDDEEFARQQLAGFMPNLLQAVTQAELLAVCKAAGVSPEELRACDYIADYRTYLSACTVTPKGFCLKQPIVFFSSEQGVLRPLAIQLDPEGELFTPSMPNAENAWLLAKMLTNCAGQTLHDVGFHQLYTHQLAAMVSISLFSEEVFNPATNDQEGPAFQTHPVFRLLRPHVVKTSEFQQTIYNIDYDPTLGAFPATRQVPASPGVYNLGFVYDLIFSCGRIGNYQLQDRMYNEGFRFLDLAHPIDVERRGVANTEFSYPYVHDAGLWWRAVRGFVTNFVLTVYGSDNEVAADAQLQRFFGKLCPAFNLVDGEPTGTRFPKEIVTRGALQEVLTLFVWQFSVQHTVVNDGAYNQAAFVPNASTLMYPPPSTPSSAWTAADVIATLPTETYPELGGMNFTDVQINASVTGQGPYPETILGRGVLEPSIDHLQDSYGFTDPALRKQVVTFFHAATQVGEAISLRQAKDTAAFLARCPDATSIPITVTFPRVAPGQVMNTIQT